MLDRGPTMKPLHTHDCDACKYLGTVDDYDLYWCPQRGLGIPTLVARYGSDGPDYTTWNVKLLGEPMKQPMLTAYVLALNANYSFERPARP